MKRLVLVFVLLSSFARGQSGYTNLLSGSSALGSGSNLWGEMAYPAAMKDLNLAMGVFGERRFMTDLANYDMVFRFGIGKQPLQLQILREGNSSFSNFTGAVAVSKKIDQNISLALRMGYYLDIAKGYSIRGSPLAGLGAMFRLNNRLTWAVQADGISSFFSGTGGRYFRFRTGMGYQLSELAQVNIELIREKELPMQAFAGLRYQFSGHLTASFGYAFQLASFLFGISFDHGGIEVQVQSGFHNALGPSAGLSLIYGLNREKP